MIFSLVKKTRGEWLVGDDCTMGGGGDILLGRHRSSSGDNGGVSLPGKRLGLAIVQRSNLVPIDGGSYRVEEATILICRLLSCCKFICIDDCTQVVPFE